MSNLFALPTFCSQPTSVTHILSTPYLMSCHMLLNCILILLWHPAIATPFCPTKLVSRRYANGSGGERMPFPSPPGLMRCLGIVAPTADYWLAPRTDLITSDIPEPNKMPYTIHENWFVPATMSVALLC